MLLYNATKNIIVSQDIYIANTFWSRLKGLLLTPKSKGRGLLIKPCNSIHTFGMKYTIDILFINKGMKIVKLARNVVPNRLIISFNSYAVIEIPSGTILETGTELNDTLSLQ